MNQRRPAILLCLCLILLSALPTTALTTDLQAAIEESTPSAEQNISPANPTQEQNPMENNESASLPEPPTREMDLETKDLRRTQNPASEPFRVEGDNLTEGENDDYYYDTSRNQLVILENKPFTIKMSDPSASASSIGIRVYAKDADITLDNVNIDTTSTTNSAIEIRQGPATIRLSGNNILISPDNAEGIQLLSSLTITSSNGDGNSNGTLTVTGGSGAAGIGPAKTRIVTAKLMIRGGTIIAQGGTNAAGIGGGEHDGEGKNASNITISGGDVTATGGDNAAGIGGGQNGNASDITISGGTVTATGGSGGAGIGGGSDGNGSKIAISGGTVNATGDTNAAGIGIGGNGSQSQITIRGGTVTASVQNSNGGIAIGGGSNATVMISPSSGHKIEATGGTNLADATPINGSPFTGSQNIADRIGSFTFFQSTTSAYTPPAPPAVRRYRIELAAEPTEGGAVSGEGRYKRNTEVTVNAAPNSGYRFVHWTENGEIMSTEANYTFSVKKNRMLVAVFAKDIVPTLEKETDDPSHSWTISFNKELDPADVTSENFYIQDANGKLLQGIRPVLLENSRQVRMENTTRFEENKDYFLVIRKGVRSAKERALAKDVIMKFQYKIK